MVKLRDPNKIYLWGVDNLETRCIKKTKKPEMDRTGGVTPITRCQEILRDVHDPPPPIILDNGNNKRIGRNTPIINERPVSLKKMATTTPIIPPVEILVTKI